MGKFINKNYSNAIGSMKQNTIDRVKNANYVFNDKPPIIVNWYNIDKEATTFDEGTGAEYSQIGKSSPIRYRKIVGAVIYGSGIRIETEMDFNEEGLGLSTQPSVSAVILPNTWIPYAGDYFTYTYGGRDYLYKVIEATFDTIDNDNNLYRITAQLDSVGTEQLEKQVNCNYRMVINNVGTSYSAIIKEEHYFTIEDLDVRLDKLRNYYVDLFYSDEVQTFVLNDVRGNLYDSEVIQFMMDNSIMEGSKENIYVDHANPVQRAFEIEYDRSIFKALEEKDKNMFISKNYYGEHISNPYTLFYTTGKNFYTAKKGVGAYSFTKISPELSTRVLTNNMVDFGDDKEFYNIIIRYFNSDDYVDDDTLRIIKNIEYKPTQELFYCIPMIIFIIEDSIKKLMKKTY